MCLRVALLKFLDVAEKSFNLVPSPVDVVIQLRVHLIASLDLGLKVLHGAVNVAERALLRVVFALLIFEMGFQLD